MSQSKFLKFYAYLESIADIVCCYPILSFSTLFLVHANYWITKFFYHLFLFFIHVMVIFHVPESNFIGLKKLTTRFRELSYIKLTDWVYSSYRLWQFNDRVDVVVAHYKEDLKWISPYLSKIDRLYLYCKDETECRRGLPSDLKGANLIVEHLPNEGRETNTYLHHIIKYYGNLSDRTVFTLASLNGNWMRNLSFTFALTEPENENRYCYPDKMFQQLLLYQLPSLKREGAVSTHLGDGYKNKLVTNLNFASHRPLGEWMQHHFKKDLFSKKCRYGYSKHGAIFSVSRDEVRSYSLELYRELLLENTGKDLLESGYFMERIWRFMFANVR